MQDFSKGGVLQVDAGRDGTSPEKVAQQARDAYTAEIRITQPHYICFKSIAKVS